MSLFLKPDIVLKESVSYSDFTLYLSLAGVPSTGVLDVNVVLKLIGSTASYLPVAGLWTELNSGFAPGYYTLSPNPSWFSGPGIYTLEFSSTLFDTFTLTVQIIENDIETVLTVLERVLGLQQQNFRLDQQVYDLRGNLVSSRIRLFSNASDATLGINAYGEYNISTSYDPQGRLIDYIVTQVL